MFDNHFEIKSKDYFVDENKNHAVNLEGTFSSKYNSACQGGSFEISKGSFRIKVVVDQIP
jgi:hypothetical protein